MAAVLLWGCDLFTTREFRSKPSDIRTLNGLTVPGDSVVFRVTESVRRPAAASPEKILSRRHLVFKLLRDSLEGPEGLKILSLRITDDSSGILLEQAERVVRFSTQGVVLEGAATGGGARFFPLKVAAGAAAGKDASAAIGADSASILAIPSLFVEGWNESQAMGILRLRRKQTSIDTIAYQGRLEESWVIEETVADGEKPIANGTFRYGASGLLKAEQVWDDFGWRSENGTNPSQSGAIPVEMELLRTLERL
ncbi:MAG: hypothetical protein JWP91_4582 [Fibrobacteres bacterium]|nr:hypothetical protein [Fibrobacterota bacterium]